MSRLNWEKANRRELMRTAERNALYRGSHGQKKTSSAQLRYMRILATENGIDVGPACCSRHSSHWIEGTKALAREGHYRKPGVT